jgi:hypothetical protein
MDLMTADMITTTGYLSIYNFVSGNEGTGLLYDDYTNVTQDSFRKSLHVGNLTHGSRFLTLLSLESRCPNANAGQGSPFSQVLVWKIF